MATKSVSASAARSRSSSRKSERPSKGAKRRATKESKPASTAPRKTQGKGKLAGSSDWSAREKKLAQIFGPTTPKGKVYAADGSLITAAAAARSGCCVMAFAPRPDRMNWIYLSHGLSAAGKHKTELAVCWKPRESSSPALALHRMVQYAASGAALGPGQVISGGEAMDLASAGYQHWIVWSPEGTLPDTLDLPGGRTKILMLMGISDAELQTALKVKPELADGRKVLLEALKAGGVFPITDPGRTCLTRRRDFHRLWENAFRLVREKMS